VCAAGVLPIPAFAAKAMSALDAGQHSAGGRDGAPMLAQAQPNASGKVFRAVGIVTATEPAGSLTINHEPIEGLMPAMEMTFAARPPALIKGVRPGDRVEFSVEAKTYAIVALKVVGHAE
jgi:Cu(I)/Ag(I) efflux system protein CusF